MSKGGQGKAFNFGKSKAKMYKGDGKKITFDDVAIDLLITKISSILGD